MASSDDAPSSTLSQSSLTEKPQTMSIDEIEANLKHADPCIRKAALSAFGEMKLDANLTRLIPTLLKMGADAAETDVAMGYVLGLTMCSPKMMLPYLPDLIEFCLKTLAIHAADKSIRVNAIACIQAMPREQADIKDLTTLVNGLVNWLSLNCEMLIGTDGEVTVAMTIRAIGVMAADKNELLSDDIFKQLVESLKMVFRGVNQKVHFQMAARLMRCLKAVVGEERLEEAGLSKEELKSESHWPDEEESEEEEDEEEYSPGLTEEQLGRLLENLALKEKKKSEENGEEKEESDPPSPIASRLKRERRPVKRLNVSHENKTYE